MKQSKKRQRETLAFLTNTIDSLLATAQQEEMGMASRILYIAKEDLVHWAATMNFHESAADRFINHMLYTKRKAATEKRQR